jgi:Holliday junction resolvasome RuvABC endonuclease subunit
MAHVSTPTAANNSTSIAVRQVLSDHGAQVNHAQGATHNDAMIAVGVDIGVLHLAVAVVRAGPHWEDATVQAVEVINTRTLEHNRVPRSACTLHHTGMAVDRVAHVTQERSALFAAAEVIIVERQPPGGLRDVEQVLVAMFRDKAVVMAPQTMHAFIGSSGLPYAERKEVAIAFAEGHVPHLRTTFPSKTDDAADAVCLALTWVHKQHQQWARTAAFKAARDTAKARGLDFEAFRYRK